MVDVSDLYYDCIDRIDLDNIENAEEYLVGCVTYLKRKTTGRADRDRVREDITMNRGLEKYRQELLTISHLSDEALSTLIASSIDLTGEIKRVISLHDKLRMATMNSDEAKVQANKAKKASDIFLRIVEILQPEAIHQKVKKGIRSRKDLPGNGKGHVKAKIVLGPTLFDGVD